MTSVITGDIIKSRDTQPDIWLETLKQALSKLEPDSHYWDIYRGDSFQIEVRDYLQSFISAVYIKACIKTIKGLDVRMAIGIGNKTFEGNNVTESNGTAFQNSGTLIEFLKREKLNLKIKTNNHNLDNELNLYFKLALIGMDNWTSNSAEIVKVHLNHPSKIQQEIAEIIGISQDAVSKRMKRANLDEILELNQMYKSKLAKLTL
ncbi:SatD family protein [Xanthomarina spongicola]|jgi:hypothetical protein|uniref:SatD family protein n=1 Tax=Xanthomarina spongicola TaxID=570520 RepID=A0A316DI19_9FLAO|nr:SatD family protein [Xanthomarina spongicola]PWK17907.1 SatD family protein [Xanthomarina spongicola]